jgi:hypothetical protein
MLVAGSPSSTITSASMCSAMRPAWPEAPKRSAVLVVREARIYWNVMPARAIKVSPSAVSK